MTSVRLRYTENVCCTIQFFKVFDFQIVDKEHYLMDKNAVKPCLTHRNSKNQLVFFSHTHINVLENLKLI